MTDNALMVKGEDPFIAMMERLACNKDVDVAKLEKMLDMQERIMDRQAEMEFNIAMSALREELPAIMKNKHNSQTNSDYADLDAIKQITDKLLPKHGFYDRYEDDYPSDGLIGTTCEIVHRSGHSKKNRVQFALDDKGIKGVSNKTSLHAGASTMSYGQRNALCRALGIRTTKDNDGNGAAVFVSNEQAVEIDLLIAEKKADKARFLTYMKVDDVRSIRGNEYVKAIKALNAKKETANVAA